ncbi:hypothetical protein PWT90_01359 [Aphanocladium album]|nr:hypothetical protein PWT90_01359 [Aphanocladium album]
MSFFYQFELQLAALQIFASEGAEFCDWVFRLAGEKTQPETNNDAEKESSNNPENSAEDPWSSSTFFCYAKPSRRVLLLLTIGSSSWVSVASFCLLCGFLNSNEQLDQLSIPPPKLLVPLFLATVVFYAWKIASAAGNQAASRLDAVYRWRAAWPAQWFLGTVFLYTLGAVFVGAFEPFAHPESCHIIPGLCRMNKMYEHSFWARLSYWSIDAVRFGGFATLVIPLLLMKVLSGSRCLLVLYFDVFRVAVCRFLVNPVLRYVVRPLSRPHFPPRLEEFESNTVAESTRSDFMKSLTQIFPGPRSRSEPLLGEPSSHPPLFRILCAVGYLLAVFFATNTAPTDIDGSNDQKWNTINCYNLVTFYSMMLWLVWRLAAILNSSAAVSLEALAYNSRTGLLLQALMGIPWQYFLFRKYPIVVDIFEDQEKILGLVFDILPFLNASSTARAYVDIVGYGILASISFGLLLGWARVATYIGCVQLACLRKSGWLNGSAAEAKPSSSGEFSLEKGSFK